MDIKKISNVEGINPVGLERTSKANPLNGPSFKETLNQIGSKSDTLKSQTGNIASPLKFSNHAVERMVSRNIRFSPENMEKLNDAVSKAASKGSKNSLILMDENALIVSVKNNTVVTVVDKNSMKENVFTNIDSTIVI